MAYSEAQKRATIKYRKKRYERLTIDLLPEEKERIKEGADRSSMSVKRYLLALVDADASK